jgi:hypothetical protein
LKKSRPCFTVSWAVRLFLSTLLFYRSGGELAGSGPGTNQNR